METENAHYIYKNEIDKASFQHDMAYGKYKDLDKGTQSDKVLKDKTFKSPSNPKYNEYQRGWAPMVSRFFDKKSVLLADKSALQEVALTLFQISILWIYQCNLQTS